MTNIDVASIGHDLAAAHTALKQVNSTRNTLLFKAGVYTFDDQFRLQTKVTLLGEPGAVIKGAGNFTGGLLQIARGSDGVVIDGLEVTGSPDKGIEANEAKNFEVRNCHIYGNATLGFHLLRSQGAKVNGNDVHNNGSNGIDAHGDTEVVIINNKCCFNGSSAHGREGNGILSYCSQRVLIARNVCYNNAQGQPGHRDGIRVGDNGGQNGELPGRFVTVEENLCYDDQATRTQGWAVNLFGPGKTLDDITVRNNKGHGNLHAGIRTKGLRAGGTIVVESNSL